MTTIEDAYQRFCIHRYPLPSEDQLSEVERRICVKFPEEYRQFVLDFNGGYFKCPEITPVGEGCPLEALQGRFGIGASHRNSELAKPSDSVLFDDNDPPKVIPIGYTSMGDLIILDTAPGDGNGEIYLKQAWGEFYDLVDGIEAFMALLREPTWMDSRRGGQGSQTPAEIDRLVTALKDARR